MLTTQQIKFFKTFGFLWLRQQFTAAEMNEIIQETDKMLAKNEGRKTGPSHQSVDPFVEQSSSLGRLPEDDRIYRPMQQVLGKGFVWGNSEGVSGSFNETNDHQWHCDRAGQIDLQYTRVKIMIYLQPMRKDAGALRVIPGSHHLSFHRRLLPLQSQEQGSSQTAFGIGGSDLCCFPLEVDLGDVVIFNHYLFHGVFGKQSRRRYVALKFAAKIETEQQYDALRPHRQDASCLHENYRYSDRPRIQEMVEGLLTWEKKVG